VMWNERQDACHHYSFPSFRLAGTTASVGQILFGWFSDRIGGQKADVRNSRGQYDYTMS